MIDCPRCHTTNTPDSRYCRHCGLSQANTVPAEPQRQSGELPPIPDGGLAEAMPDWLRAPLASAPATPNPSMRSAAPASVDSHPTAADAAPIDPRTFLTDDDLSRWLRELSNSTGRAASNGEPAMPWDQAWSGMTALTRSTPPPTAAATERRAAPTFAGSSPTADLQRASSGLAPGEQDHLVVLEAVPSAIGQPASTRIAWPHLLLLMAVILILLALGVIAILGAAGRL